MEAYRSALSGKGEATRTAVRRLLRALEMTRKGRLGPEELGIDFKMHHMMLRELEFMLTHESEIIEGEPREASKRKVQSKV